METLCSNSFSYYDNLNSRKILDKIMEAILENNGEESQIYELLKNEDFRILGPYLYALKEKDIDILEAIKDICISKEKRKYFNQIMFKKQFPQINNLTKKLVFVDTIEEVFSNGLSKGVITFTSSLTIRKQFEVLFNEVLGEMSSFINSHYDLPGVNSLVRRGLVKSIILDNDCTVVTKCNNPNKKGKFLKEQSNILSLIKILHLDEEDSYIQLINKKSIMKVVRPLIVFADVESQKFYSMSRFIDGHTLEEILLNIHDLSLRSSYLNDVRAILDTLYSKGILWGDLAPRNIIIRENQDSREYFLLDFEKTEILDHVVTLSERKNHCRGPMCVEEFGAVCSREEIEECFKGYFVPKEWCTEPGIQITLHKPKPDFISILEIRGEKKPDMAQYNKLELEIMDIRFPFFEDSSNKIKYPLYTGFKIDHYLGFEYDRKVTQILLAAKEQQCFVQILNILEDAIQNYENKLIEGELYNIYINNLVDFNDKCFELNFIKGIINHFYSCISNLSMIDIKDSKNLESLMT